MSTTGVRIVTLLLHHKRN